MEPVDDILDHLVQRMPWQMASNHGGCSIKKADPYASLHWHTEVHHEARKAVLWHSPTVAPVNQ